MISITVPFLLPNELADWLKVAYPGYNILPTGTTLSDHPRLHIERLIAEDYICRTLGKEGGMVCDIGGNPSRHRALGRNNVWCCCPELSAQDVIRRKRYIEGNWCTHTVETCVCHDFVAYMSVHSVYYIPGKTWLTLSMKGPVMIACHEFNDGLGYYYDEASYNKIGSLVTMNVTGCSYEYKHQSPEFVYDGSYKSIWHGMAVFNKVRTFQHTSVYTVCYSKWIYPVTERRTMRVQRLWKEIKDDKDGRDLVMVNNVCMPSALLAVLYFEALKQRNVDFNSLMIAADAWFTKWQSKACVNDVVVMAAEAVKWVLLTYKQYMALSVNRPGIKAAILRCLVSLLAPVLRVLHFLRYNSLYFLRSDDRIRVKGTDCGKAVRSGEYKILQYPDDARDATSYIDEVGVTPWREEKPVIFNQTTENILYCLDVRAFRRPNKVDEQTFNRFVSWLPQFWTSIFGKWKHEFIPTDFDSWNARFAPAVQARHKKALERGNFPNKNDCKARNCFLKQEITWKADGKPRLITGVSDTFKICVGPYLHALSKVIGAKLQHTNIVYAPGLNVLQLGRFYDQKKKSISTDMSAFDSCVTQCFMEAMLSLYVHFKFPIEIIGALKHSIQQQLYFRKGLVVVPDNPRRSSGHPNTTLENTMLNIALHCFALQGQRYRMMAGGDDVILQDVDDTKFCETIELLGFEPKPMVCEPYKGRFYSGWFIPSQEGLVLTGFLGRRLSKLGYDFSTVESLQTEVYSMSVTSARAEYSHIEKLCKLFELMGAKKTANKTVRLNYLLPKVDMHQCGDTLSTLEIVYPGFQAIIDDLCKNYKSGVSFYTPAFKLLLAAED